MKIKRLILTSFGKFKDKTIEISDGFNLIYGENEAGKSTIQAFIEGMFFGFYKPYRKKRMYSEEFERYRPWNSETYCGAIIFEDENGHDIRVERDFLKKQDGVKIYNNITGKEITSDYAYDYITRQAQPLSHYGINRIVYNNTVNVRQRAGLSDEEMAGELNDKLLEMGASDDDGISLGRITAQLQNRKKAIGSYGQSHSDYGRAVRELSRLEDQLEESERVYQDVQKNQKLIQKYREKIEQVKLQCEDASAQKQAMARAGMEKMQQKVAGIREEGDALKKRLEELKPYENYDVRVYGRLKILQNSIEQADEQIKVLEEELQDLSSRLKKIDQKKNKIEAKLKGLKRSEIEEDHRAYCRIRQQQSEDSTEEAQDQGTTEQTLLLPLDIPNGAQIALTIIGVLLVGIAFMNPGSVLSGLVQFLLAFVGWFLVAGGIAMLTGARNFIGNKQTRLSVSNSAESLETILEKYGRKNADDFETFAKKACGIFDGLDQMEADRKALLQTYESKKDKRSALIESREGYTKDMDDLLLTTGAQSVEDYNRGCELKNEYERVKAETEGNSRLYNELSDSSMVPVEEVEAVKDNPVIMVTPEGEKIHAREAIMAFSDEITRLQSENALMTKNVPNPVDTEESIETLKKEIAHYEEELQACDIALNAFERLSRESHSDNAGQLNEKVGSILNQITHKYEEVKIDEQLKIHIVNPDGSGLIGIDKLSGGTMDQIYLALRFGIGDIMKISGKLPFILDDPFVQYDYSRKSEALHYLCTLSKGHQVLLLTCSGDEKRILDDCGEAYRGIVL